MTKIKLPPEWSEIYADTVNWPDENMRNKLAYADGSRKIIYYRSKKHWSNWPIIRWLIHTHEIIHAIQYIVTGDMYHVKKSGIMTARYTPEWWLTPIVSLCRWSWFSDETKELLKNANY